MLDSLCVPLKVIQERAGHALTGSFTLDVYGGKPEWTGNVEAARKAGQAIEQAVAKVQETEPFVGFNCSRRRKAPDGEIGSPYESMLVGCGGWI